MVTKYHIAFIRMKQKACWIKSNICPFQHPVSHTGLPGASEIPVGNKGNNHSLTVAPSIQIYSAFEHGGFI